MSKMALSHGGMVLFYTPLRPLYVIFKFTRLLDCWDYLLFRHAQTGKLLRAQQSANKAFHLESQHRQREEQSGRSHF